MLFKYGLVSQLVRVEVLIPEAQKSTEIQYKPEEWELKPVNKGG